MSMSKLESVNLCLKAIGEDPVNSLTSGLSDAETAEDFVDQTAKQVLKKGWQVNTEDNVKLLPDIEGHIAIPHNTLKIDTTGYSKHVRVRKKGNRLYNVRERTEKFTSALFVDIVIDLPFEDLSFTLQNYIAVLAAQKFQASVLGSVAMDGFTNRDVTEAYVELLEDEADAEDSNVLHDNSFTHTMSYRYSPTLW